MANAEPMTIALSALLSNLLQGAVVYLPILNRLFHAQPLGLSDVLPIGAAGPLVLRIE
jgi:hypothetical protein